LIAGGTEVSPALRGHARLRIWWNIAPVLDGRRSAGRVRPVAEAPDEGMAHAPLAAFNNLTGSLII